MIMCTNSNRSKKKQNLEKMEIMEKLLKNGILKSLLSTALFVVFYTLLTFVIEGTVEIDIVLVAMVSNFLVMCVFYFVVPKLRKKTGHDKDNN